MSDSVWPHRRQPIRLHRPWESPGKNTGVVAISFSSAWKWKVKVKLLSRIRLFTGLQPTRLPCPWDSPGKNTGVVAISFSNAWKWKVKVKSLSHVWLLATPWSAAYWAPPSMGFSRQEYWSGVSLPSLGKLDSYMQKNEIRTLLHTIYKNKLKMD